MMKVIYDFQTFFQQELSRIPRHVCVLASQMSRFLGIDIKTVALFYIDQCDKDSESRQVIG